MRFPFFGIDRQVSVAEIEQKRKEFLAKTEELTKQIRAEESVLADLSEQHTSAAVERLLTDSAEAHAHDKALSAKIAGTMKRISGMKQDLHTLNQLTPELESRLAAAKNREILDTYHKAASRVVELSGQIAEALAPIAPLIIEAESELQKACNIAGTCLRGYTRSQSIWWDLVLAAVALHINPRGNAPGLPKAHDFRKETLESANDLKSVVRCLFEREHQRIANALTL